MIEGKTIHCLQVGEGTVCDGRSRPTSRDRTVAQCFLDKVEIAEQMIRSGTACDWPKFSGGRYKISDTLLAQIGFDAVQGPFVRPSKQTRPRV